MCGICGIFHFNQRINPEDLAVLKTMQSLSKQRGPDDEGSWMDSQHCAFGFRRLAILDLSPSGHQPMLTPDERYTIVINGEIYNFKDLRAELESRGWRFRSTGDAEVALFALAEWGKEALDRFNGIFALAFYDRQEKSLLLARDHVGGKPLYYLQDRRGLVFGSQYDQILAHPWSKKLSINQGALALYLRFDYIPSPYAILENTHLLEAGSWLEANLNGEIQKGKYFEFPTYQAPDLFGLDAIEVFESTLVGAVRRQMVSDVPLGSFLSGGIDSPLICSIAQSLNNEPIKAFTIGVPNSPLDETSDAIRYAQRIGVDHHIANLDFSQVEDLALEVTAACSEPFGDYSIFPTLLVSKFAKEKVKVMLSGDGADELFWGYIGRMGNAILFAHLFKLPFWFRKLRWWLLRRHKEWNLRYFKTPGEWFQANHEHNSASLLNTIFPDITQFPKDYDQYTYDGNTADKAAQWVRWNEFTGHMGNGLLKVDRGSMYHGLEVRTPILDREVIKTGLRINWQTCFDIEKPQGKIPLRQVLLRRVGFTTEGKRGFTVPMGDWLRGPLRPMFEDLVLSRDNLLGLPLQQDQMRLIFDQHLSKQHNRDWGLWILLSLALWEKQHYHRWNH
jgi:asparagine synthase (glutamine-hydrolysing)